MAIEPPAPDIFLPFVQQALKDYPYFEENAASWVANLMPVRMKRGVKLFNEDLTPSDFGALKAEFRSDPIGALRTVIDRTHFLWRCSRDMEAITVKSAGFRAFVGLEVRFCNFCPPSRAGKRLHLSYESLDHHPLLDCALPVCDGAAYPLSRRKAEQAGFDALPPA